MAKWRQSNSLRKAAINNKFLHEITDSKALFETVGKEQRAHGYELRGAFIEKDYWLMHCLWGLQQQGYDFALKGGTFLSKGFGIIERFSEDIDIQIFPKKNEDVKTGKNNDKPEHIESRRRFFDRICNELSIVGLTFAPDPEFDASA